MWRASLTGALFPVTIASMGRYVWLSVSIVFLVHVHAVAPARGQEGTLIPPADAPVARHFEAPTSDYGPGHRGLDFHVPVGTPVRAAGTGIVRFAGSVGDVRAVTLDHGGGLATTYSSLSDISVSQGETVVMGTWIGRSGVAHASGEPGLHFGVKLSGEYVDPLAYFVPVDHGSAFSLVPVVPDDLIETLSERGIDDLSTLTVGCARRDRLRRAVRPPNDNVAVAVAGIGSHTAGDVSAEIYTGGPTLLGYPESSIYRFSYRGTQGPDLHEPYRGTETYGDIDSAAARLRGLMRHIALRHPGADVDLLAHSQGGVVARAYLASLSGRPDPTLPRVEHLVTYSTPHEGAPLAGAASKLARGSLGGKLVLEALSAWANKGGPIPDPLARAVDQLSPGSDLLTRLDDSALPFGTRALTIAIPNDLVVPADRAGFNEAADAVVPPGGLNGHDAVVWSSAARSAAYSFLGGAAEVCDGGWDRWGPRIGRVVSFVEGLVPRALRVLPGF